MTQQLRAFTPFNSQFPGSLVRFHNHLGLQFQGIRHPFLASAGTFSHMKSHGYIHISKNNFVIFKII